MSAGRTGCVVFQPGLQAVFVKDVSASTFLGGNSNLVLVLEIVQTNCACFREWESHRWFPGRGRFSTRQGASCAFFVLCVELFLLGWIRYLVVVVVVVSVLELSIGFGGKGLFDLQGSSPKTLFCSGKLVFDSSVARESSIPAVAPLIPRRTDVVELQDSGT